MVLPTTIGANAHIEFPEEKSSEIEGKTQEIASNFFNVNSSLGKEGGTSASHFRRYSRRFSESSSLSEGKQDEECAEVRNSLFNRLKKRTQPQEHFTNSISQVSSELSQVNARKECISAELYAKIEGIFDLLTPAKSLSNEEVVTLNLLFKELLVFENVQENRAITSYRLELVRRFFAVLKELPCKTALQLLDADLIRMMKRDWYKTIDSRLSPTMVLSRIPAVKLWLTYVCIYKSKAYDTVATYFGMEHLRVAHEENRDTGFVKELISVHFSNECFSFNMGEHKKQSLVNLLGQGNVEGSVEEFIRSSYQLEDSIYDQRLNLPAADKKRLFDLISDVENTGVSFESRLNVFYFHYLNYVVNQKRIRSSSIEASWARASRIIDLPLDAFKDFFGDLREREIHAQRGFFSSFVDAWKSITRFRSERLESEDSLRL
jgi:hypothetical protein